MLSIGVVVENVRVVGISAIHPDESPVGFTEPLFDHGQRGGIGLNNEAFQDQLPHSLNNRLDQGGDFSRPTKIL